MQNNKGGSAPRWKPPHYDDFFIPEEAIRAVLNSHDHNLTKQRLLRELEALATSRAMRVDRLPESEMI